MIEVVFRTVNTVFVNFCKLKMEKKKMFFKVGSRVETITENPQG